MSWVHRRLGLETEDQAYFNCLNYCDDFGGAEALKSRADTSFITLATLLAELGLKESEDKAGPPSQEMTYLGVHFNSVTMTMSVVCTS